MAGGYAFYSWTDATSATTSGNVSVTWIDIASGTRILAASQQFTGVRLPRMIAVGTKVILLAATNSSPNIQAIVFDTAALTLSAASNIVTDNHSGDGEFDLATNGTNFFVVYRDASDKVHVRSFTTALAAVASKTSAETNSPQSFGITVTAGERVWVTYAYNVGTWHARACAFDEALSTETVAPFDLFTSTTEQILATAPKRVSSTTAVAVINIAGDGPAWGVLAPVFNTSGAIVSNATATNRRTYWTQAASKPFLQGSKFYIWAYAGGTRFTSPTPPTQQLLQYSLILVDIGADNTSSTGLRLRPVCTLAPRFAYQQSVTDPIGQTLHMSNAASAASNKWTAAALVLRTNGGRVGVVGATADFGHTNRGQPANNGGRTHLTPGAYDDGRNLQEIGFCYWPQEVSVSVNVSGGSLVIGKKYRWRIVYAVADFRGQMHRSAPSDYTESTVSSTTVSVVGAQLCLGSAFKTALVIAELYRTTEDPDDSSAYYLSATQIATPTASTITVVDGAADAAITKNQQLYTMTGALRRVQPPGFSCLVSYRGRLWGSHANQLWYSGAFVEGEAPWFADQFVQSIDSSENITAMWVMDDTLYISTATKIYYLQADGPADNGNANDVVLPYRVATDLGCIEPRSVVITPLGTFYQGATGLQLLNRKREVQAEPFGARVQTTLATYPTVVAATVHPSGGYVLFWCTNGSTSARIVYDYTKNEFAVDTSSLFGAFASAAVKGSTVWWMNATNLYKESADYLDAGAWVTRTVELADFHPTGVQGLMKFLRLKLLGERFTSHGLTVDFAKDYAASYFDTRSYSDAELDALPLEQADFSPKDARAQAMRVKITDTTPSTGALGTGQGGDLVAFSMDFDPLGNQFQLPAAARK
jgi:hypothetical protein